MAKQQEFSSFINKVNYTTFNGFELSHLTMISRSLFIRLNSKVLIKLDKVDVEFDLHFSTVEINAVIIFKTTRVSFKSTTSLNVYKLVVNPATFLGSCITSLNSRHCVYSISKLTTGSSFQTLYKAYLYQEYFSTLATIDKCLKEFLSYYYSPVNLTIDRVGTGFRVYLNESNRKFYLGYADTKIVVLKPCLGVKVVKTNIGLIIYAYGKNAQNRLISYVFKIKLNRDVCKYTNTGIFIKPSSVFIVQWIEHDFFIVKTKVQILLKIRYV